MKKSRSRPRLGLDQFEPIGARPVWREGGSTDLERMFGTWPPNRLILLVLEAARGGVFEPDEPIHADLLAEARAKQARGKRLDEDDVERILGCRPDPRQSSHRKPEEVRASRAWALMQVAIILAEEDFAVEVEKPDDDEPRTGGQQDGLPLPGLSHPSWESLRPGAVYLLGALTEWIEVRGSGLDQLALERQKTERAFADAHPERKAARLEQTERSEEWRQRVTEIVPDLLKRDGSQSDLEVARLVQAQLANEDVRSARGKGPPAVRTVRKLIKTIRSELR